MSWLAVIPVALLLAACLYRPKARLVMLTPELKPEERIQRWRAAYDRLPIEEQIAPGEWPFVPSAVHALPRDRQTDPRELLR
jgi:hypothetical protein